MKRSRSLRLLFYALLLVGCATSHERSGFTVATQTRQTQTAMTPAAALALLRAGNERFATGHMLHRDLLEQVKATSGGQYPFAVIVSCLDSRASAELIFDQGLGDIFSARVAGNVVNVDILGSLEFGTKLAGAKLIAVIGHSNCGAIKGACDGAQLGNLTELLAHIQPAVEAVKTPPGAVRTSKNHEFVEQVAETNVRLVMKAIRERSPVIRELIDSGQIGLVGGMYDLETGRVTFFHE